MKNILFLLGITALTVGQPIQASAITRARHHSNAACLIVGTIVFLGCSGGLIASLVEYKFAIKFKDTFIKTKPDKPSAIKKCIFYSLGALIGTAVCIYGLGNTFTDMQPKLPVSPPLPVTPPSFPDIPLA